MGKQENQKVKATKVDPVDLHSEMGSGLKSKEDRFRPLICLSKLFRPPHAIKVNQNPIQVLLWGRLKNSFRPNFI